MAVENLKEVSSIARQKKRGIYDNKIQVKEGTSFMDIINASIQDAALKKDEEKRIEIFI